MAAPQRTPPAAGVSLIEALVALAVMVVHERGRLLRVPAAEVLYLKAEQKYVSLCTALGRWLLDEPLTELEQRLGPGFLRVHRNAVVALVAVRALARRGAGGAGAAGGLGEAPEGDETWQVQMSNGDWLAVSRRQLPEVRQAVADVAGRAP